MTTTPCSSRLVWDPSAADWSVLGWLWSHWDPSATNWSATGWLWPRFEQQITRLWGRRVTSQNSSIGGSLVLRVHSHISWQDYANKSWLLAQQIQFWEFMGFGSIQLSPIPEMKPLSTSYYRGNILSGNKKQKFQEKVKPNIGRIQSRVSWKWKHSELRSTLKARRVPARIHSKTNLPSSRGSLRCL